MSPRFAFSPRTPQTPRFRTEKPDRDGFDEVSIDEKIASKVETKSKEGDRDLEKGLQKPKPKPDLSIKMSRKAVEPPPLSAKLSGWTKVFGRG